MDRKEKIIPNIDLDLNAILNYYKVCCYLNSNNSSKPNYLGLGVHHLFEKKENIFEELNKFYSLHKDWIFGYFPYDLKNEIEPSLFSKNQNFIQLKTCHFFIPKLLILIHGENSRILYHEEKDLKEFLTIKPSNEGEVRTKPIHLTPKISKEEYLQKVSSIKKHIEKGDIYEMNFCYEYIAENISLEPVKVYFRLNELTKAPFSCYYKNETDYILSGSPERFLKKEKNKIISQPIKGTKRRGLTVQEDDQLKKELAEDKKERSENIMIVDLVRNDLSRTAEKGSVKVEELCKVYTFETVHQLISTISSTIHPNTSFFDVIKYAFPMGSMTGAPKIEAMKIIEKFESSIRGVYSGAIGYITPHGEFDFNVVIRTILYNKKLKRCSFMVGGAITLQSDPEQEYNETLLKAEALKKALN